MSRELDAGADDICTGDDPGGICTVREDTAPVCFAPTTAGLKNRTAEVAMTPSTIVKFGRKAAQQQPRRVDPSRQAGPLAE